MTVRYFDGRRRPWTGALKEAIAKITNGKLGRAGLGRLVAPVWTRKASRWVGEKHGDQLLNGAFYKVRTLYTHAPPHAVICRGPVLGIHSLCLHIGSVQEADFVHVISSIRLPWLSLGALSGPIEVVDRE